MGYGPALELVGSYFVEGVEIGLTPPRSITVSATAVAMSAASGLKAPHTHTWSETTLGAVVRASAEEHALEPRVSPEIADVQIAHIDQSGESDLALLQRLAREYGCLIKAAAGRLIAMPPGVGAAPGSGRELPVRTVAPGDVVRGRVRASAGGVGRFFVRRVGVVVAGGLPTSDALRQRVGLVAHVFSTPIPAVWGFELRDLHQWVDEAVSCGGSTVRAERNPSTIPRTASVTMMMAGRTGMQTSSAAITARQSTISALPPAPIPTCTASGQGMSVVNRV